MNDLFTMSDLGLAGDVPSDAVFLNADDSIIYGPDHPDLDLAMLQNHGYAPMFTPVWATPYYKLDHRPYALVGIWGTEFGGQQFYIVVHRWMNSDASFGFLGGIIAPRASENAAQRLRKFRSLYGRSTIWPSGSYFADRESCEAYTAEYEFIWPGFCQWYFANTELTLALEIFRRWEQQGLLSNQAIRADGHAGLVLPLFPASFAQLETDP